MEYLRIEGMCYCGIGILFCSTACSAAWGGPACRWCSPSSPLGTRVALAYLLAPIPAVGLKGIWWAVPIGWVLADLAGLVLWRRGAAERQAHMQSVKAQNDCKCQISMLIFPNHIL